MWNRISHIFLGRGLVFKNFLALAVLQGTNFLIPLIIMPYLIQTIGIKGYGIVGFVHAIMIYFISLTDYGFNISATRDIAINREDHNTISKIFSKVIVTKCLLLILSFLVLCFLNALVPDFNEISFVIFIGFSVVVGQTLLPVWFFQGMEQMKYITYLNVASKLIFTLLIFLFVKKIGDEYLVLLFLGLGNAVSGLFGLILAMKQYKLTFVKVSLKDIQQELVMGWNLFLSNFSIVSYMNSNVFILGLFTSSLVVGYYSVAEKIVMALRQVLTVFHQATYPHICKIALEGKQVVIQFYKQIFVPFTFMILLACAGVYVFAFEIITFFANEAENSIGILRLLCFTPFIVVLNIPAYQYLLANKFEKSATFILVLGSLLNIALNLILVQIFEANGTAISVIITEILITMGLHFILYFRHSDYRLYLAK